MLNPGAHSNGGTRLLSFNSRCVSILKKGQRANPDAAESPIVPELCGTTKAHELFAEVPCAHACAVVGHSQFTMALHSAKVEVNTGRFSVDSIEYRLSNRL